MLWNSKDCFLGNDGDLLIDKKNIRISDVYQSYSYKQWKEDINLFSEFLYVTVKLKLLSSHVVVWWKLQTGLIAVIADGANLCWLDGLHRLKYDKPQLYKDLNSKVA